MLINPNNQTIIQDAGGRRLVCQNLTTAENFLLNAIVGPNDTARNLGSMAFFVRSIDDQPRAEIATVRDVYQTLIWLGEIGAAAINAWAGQQANTAGMTRQ